MLVFTRRIGETLFIELPSGEQVEITILDAQGHRVRIGAAAPQDVMIVREEALPPHDCAIQHDNVMSLKS